MRNLYHDLIFTLSNNTQKHKDVKKTQAQQIKEIQTIVSKFRKVEDRVKELKTLNYNVTTCPMGSGGVGQVKTLKAETRVQISYAWGKHNYAYAVIL